MRASRYPDFEVVVAADRCTDATASIVRRHVVADPERVRLVEIDRCPEGWSGKCHASWQGTRPTRGDWLLFADADTTFHPDLLRASVGLCLAQGLDFLSLLGRLTSSRPFERVAQPVAAMALMKMYPLHRANRNGRRGRRRPFANGQFMLFRRCVYEAIGTHEFVGNALLEDLRFARRLNRDNAYRMGVALAHEMFVVRMYETPEDFRRGWKRIYTEAANRSLARLRANAWRLRAMAISPFVLALGVACGVAAAPLAPLLGPATAALSLAALTAMALALAVAYRLQGLPFSAVRHYPRGCLDVASIFGEAASDLAQNRGIEWASLTYRVEGKARN